MLQACGTGFQVQQAPGQAQQSEQLDQRGVAQAACRIALAVQQRRQIGGKLPAVQIGIGEALACQARQQCQHGAALR